MASFSELHTSRNHTAHTSSLFSAVAQRSSHDASTHQSAHLLPRNPASIPVESAAAVPRRSALPSPGRLEIGLPNSRLEREADAMATRVVNGTPTAGDRLQSASSLPFVEAPPQVHEARDSIGKPLDGTTRTSMEAHMGADLGGVRVHTSTRAIAAAQSVRAQAYTVGSDIYFNEGRFNPRTAEGRRLLAHELSHTVQQSGGAGGHLSGVAPAVHRDPLPQSASKESDTSADKKKKPEAVTVHIPHSELSQFKLTPPSLLAPGQQRTPFSPGSYSLAGPGASLLPPLSHFFPSTPLPYAPVAPSPVLTPQSSSGSASPTASPKAPDRLSFADLGVLSIGARIGFPDLSSDAKSSDAPNALQESIKKGEILNFMLTGAAPSEYSMDPAKLVGALWGIFATKIDPALAAKIAAGMSSKPPGSSVSYQLDVTLLLDLGGKKPGGGAGATLTVNF